MDQCQRAMRVRIESPIRVAPQAQQLRRQHEVTFVQSELFSHRCLQPPKQPWMSFCFSLVLLHSTCMLVSLAKALKQSPRSPTQFDYQVEQLLSLHLLKALRVIEGRDYASLQKSGKSSMRKFRPQIRTKNIEMQMTCRICFDSSAVKSVSFASCGHSIHKQCIVSYVNGLIRQKKPLVCPQQGCVSKITQRFIRQQLGPEVFKDLLKNWVRMFVREAGVVYNLRECEANNCKDIYIMQYPWPKYITCRKDRNKIYCPICKGRHYDLQQNCIQYEEQKKTPGLVQTLNLFKCDKFRKCNNCKHLVEKNEGCNHITCICGYEFCFVCGGRWPTCECVLNRIR